MSQDEGGSSSLERGVGIARTFTVEPESLAGKFFRRSFNSAGAFSNQKKVSVEITKDDLLKALEKSKMMGAMNEEGLDKLLEERFPEVKPIPSLEKRQKMLIGQNESIKETKSTRSRKSRLLSHNHNLRLENDRILEKLQRRQRAIQTHPFDLVKDEQEKDLLIAALLGHAYAPRKLVELFGDKYKPLLAFTVRKKQEEGTTLGLTADEAVLTPFVKPKTE